MQPTTKKQFQRARAVIQSLVHGLDPESGTELPKDSVVNKIDVNRALTMGVFALDQMMARLTRRAQLPESVGKAWTFEEEQQLRDESVRGETVPVIAAKHGRTIRAIEARLEKLGLLTPEARTTNTSFLGNQKRGDK